MPWTAIAILAVGFIAILQRLINKFIIFFYKSLYSTQTKTLKVLGKSVGG